LLLEPTCVSTSLISARIDSSIAPLVLVDFFFEFILVQDEHTLQTELHCKDQGPGSLVFPRTEVGRSTRILETS